MKQLITATATFGPFSDVESHEDHYICDGVVYPFSVLGDASISEYVPVPPTISVAEHNAPILAALAAIDTKTIRPLREGDTDRIAMLDAEAAALRAQLRK